jgi:hypothetical protein
VQGAAAQPFEAALAVLALADAPQPDRAIRIALCAGSKSAPAMRKVSQALSTSFQAEKSMPANIATAPLA